jgi:hypothetical protein
MKLLRNGVPILICAATIIVVFIAVSLLDIVISVMYARFYSNAAFVVTFGVGGIFAAVLGYMNGNARAPEKNGITRWLLIAFLFLTGICFFFYLAKLEGGEYEAAFKGFGATLSLASLLFLKEDISA